MLLLRNVFTAFSRCRTYYVHNRAVSSGEFFNISEFRNESSVHFLTVKALSRSVADFRLIQLDHRYKR